jgi:hypothetical protein
MVKSAFSILAVAAVGGIVLAPMAASAATAAPSVLAYSSSPSQDTPTSADTTVTFTVSSGSLTMTAPGTVDLGTNGPGTTISGLLGPVTVTDNRALLAATWTVSASSTNWTTGASTPAETIPATDVGYDPGTVTTTPTDGLATGTTITLANTPAPVVSLAAVGDNAAAWNPTISVAVPSTAVTGAYTATLTQSVL